MKYSLLKKLAVFLFFTVLLLRSGFSEDLNWVTTKYPNGFTLVTKEIHSHPSCSVHLFVSVGSINEPSNLNGISHLYEHLFFKGTKRRTSTQMKSEMENYGGDINGSTYRDYTEFIVNVPSAYADKAVDYLLDAYRNATFEPGPMENERKVVLDEVSLDFANPERQLSDVFQSMIYSVHPYRTPVAGSPESVKRITRQDIINWKNKYYVPSNSYLIVVGDVDTKKIEAQVQSLIGDMPDTPYVTPTFPKEPARTQPVVREMNQQVDQCLFLLGYLVTGLDTPEDIYPMDVLTFMFGYGRSSLLTRELRDRLHLVTNVNADFLTQRYPSTFQIGGIAKKDDLEALRRAILQIIDKIKAGDINQEEIDRAKTLLDGVYTLGNETNNGKVSTIGFYVAMGSGDFAKSYLSHIKEVTAADIERVAKKYFQDNYAEVIFLPTSKKTKDKKDE